MDHGEEVIVKMPYFQTSGQNMLVNEGSTIKLPCIVNRLGKMTCKPALVGIHRARGRRLGGWVKMCNDCFCQKSFFVLDFFGTECLQRAMGACLMVFLSRFFKKVPTKSKKI